LTNLNIDLNYRIKFEVIVLEFGEKYFCKQIKDSLQVQIISENIVLNSKEIEGINFIVQSNQKSNTYKALINNSKIISITISGAKIDNLEHKVFNVSEIPNLRDSYAMRYIPSSIYSLLGPENLYLLMGPQPLFYNIDYKFRGPEKLILALAKVSKDKGAPLHKHTLAYEMFYVVKGLFKVVIGLKDPDILYIKEGDLIVINKGFYRKFTNVDSEDGVLLPMVVGTNDESEDIVFPNRLLNKFNVFNKLILKSGQLLGLIRFE